MRQMPTWSRTKPYTLPTRMSVEHSNAGLAVRYHRAHFHLKNPRISRLLMLRLRLKRRKTHFSYKQPVHHLITAVTAHSFTSRLSPPLCRSAVGQPSYWFIQPALAPQLKPTIYPYGPQSVPGRFLFKSKIGLLKQFCPLLNNKFSAV